MSRYLIVDVATAPLQDAKDYLDLEGIEAPSHYKDPVKIAEYVEKAKQAQLDKAALDPDLCRISGIGLMGFDTQVFPTSAPASVLLARGADEKDLLLAVRDLMEPSTILVGFNSRVFDWRVLQRRAIYLGVKFPHISVDRFRGSHIDLFDVLSDKGAGSAHSLGFYVKRFGWTDLVKPITGGEEARVFETGRWEDLAAALTHDVVATYRLVCVLGVA